MQLRWEMHWAQLRSPKTMMQQHCQYVQQELPILLYAGTVSYDNVLSLPPPRPPLLLLLSMQSSDAAFKELLSSVIDINAWQDAKVIAFKNVTQTKEQLRDQDNLAERIKQEIGTTEKQLLELQEQVDAWKQLHNKRLVSGGVL